MEHKKVKTMEKVIWYKINVRYPCAIFIKTSKDEYSRPWLWHHQKDQINCVIINECHSKQGVQ